MARVIEAQTQARAMRRQRTWRPMRPGTMALAGAVAALALLAGPDGVRHGGVGSAMAQTEGLTTSKAVFDAYTEAQELLEAGDSAGAANRIRRVINSQDELNAAEQGILYRFLANVELERERYPQAIDALERAMRSGAFEGPDLAELHYFLGGLYLSVERYDEAITELRRFFELAENPPAPAYYLLAQAYAIPERWREALPNAQRAVELSPNPNENYLRLLAANYINLNRWRDAVPLLERIVRLFPTKDEYWQQLAAGYQETGRERDAYAVQELRYEQGFIDTSREIVVLAELHSFYGYHFKAANLLQRELDAGRVQRTADNLEKLGNFYLASREYTRARSALIAASGQKRSGELDFRIAQTFAQDENWEQTDRYMTRALNRGGLNRNEQANAWLLLGHARNSLGRRQAAIQAFTRAAQYDRTAQDANQWLEFLRTQIEIERQQILVNAVDTINGLLDRNQAALTEVQTLRDVALTALDSAERARSAVTDQSRDRALQEYEIRVREADQILDRQRADMAEDVPASESAIETVSELELDAATQAAVDDLRTMLAERQSLMTDAVANLERAAAIVAFVQGEGPDPDLVTEDDSGDADTAADAETGDSEASADAEASEDETAADDAAADDAGDADDSVDE